MPRCTLMPGWEYAVAGLAYADAGHESFAGIGWQRAWPFAYD